MEQGDPNTPDITIRLLPQQQIPATAVNCYGLAGKIVISDTAWSELEPFRIISLGEWEGGDLPELQELGPPQGEADRSVEGWVAEQDRMVSCRDVEDGCRVAVSGIGEFFVSATGGQITALSIDPTANDAEVMTTLFGPPMILALAAQNVWLMHAGAVEQGGGAWLFIGPSGAGKSTLARELPRRGLSGRRLGDDMVPISLRGEQIVCLPAFPQLKLGAAEQITECTLQLKLSGVCILEKTLDKQAKIGLRRLAGAQIAHELASQTMGVSLFDAAAMKRHLAMTSRCAIHTPVYRAVYSHTPAAFAMLSRELWGQSCHENRYF